MRRPHRLFTLLIPALWTTISAVHFQYPGDEYGLWAVSSLPGLWLPILIREGNMVQGLWLTLLGCLPVMAALGAALDKLRAPWVPWHALWVLAAGVLCVAEIASYPSWARAMSKNGSFQAYALCSLNLGLLLSTVVTIAVTAAYRIGRRRRPSTRRKSGRINPPAGPFP